LILYPGICVRLFATLKCIEIPGLETTQGKFGTLHSGSVMAAAYDVECWRGEHWEAAQFALACIGVWVVGIPLAVFVLLRINKSKLFLRTKTPTKKELEAHEDVVAEFGTLYLQYEPAYYWWEVTVIFKKMMLTGAMTVIAAGSSMQLVIALLVVLINLLLTLKVAPFMDDADDYLAFLTSLQMLLTLLGGLLIKTDNPDDPTYDKNMMGVILIAVNSFGFFALALSLLSLHPKVRVRACLNSVSKKKKMKGKEKAGESGEREVATNEQMVVNSTKVVPMDESSNVRSWGERKDATTENKE
jgi:hypothetical protein